MSKGSSMEANKSVRQEGKGITFPEACRTPGETKDFLKPVVEEFATHLRACISRLRAHQESLELPVFTAPELTFNFLERKEDLSELPDPEGLACLSLDIFDTCLIRSLETPFDIFLILGGHVERLTGIKAGDFANARREIEQQLRQKGLEQGSREDISIDAIYMELESILKWEAPMSGIIMKKEIFLEEHFLHAVEPVRALAWKVHDLGIPLVYTSEMYLSREALGTILYKEGFPIRDIPLYSSGEYGLSKGTGNLYRAALKDLQRESFFHIGDNPESDGEVPRSLGIETAGISTTHKVYPDTFSNVLHTVTLKPGKSGKQGFWETFGFQVAGPVHFAFATHLYRKCREFGLSDLFFLSRDGWFPRKVFRKLQGAWGTVANDHYLYASREFFGIGAMTEIGPEEWDFILKPSPLLRTRDVFQRLGIPEEVFLKEISESGLPGKNERICHHWGFKDPRMRDRLYASLCRCLPDFLEYRDTVRARLLPYLEKSGVFSESSAIVDLGWNASSALTLAGLAPERELAPAGIYFALLNPVSDRVSSYFTTGGQRMEILKGSIAMMEFIFGSPEPTAMGVEMCSGSFQPLFRKEWLAHEVEAWNMMNSGILRYAEACLEVLGTPIMGDGTAYVEATLQRFLFDPSEEELVNMESLSHSEGWGTDNRLRFLPRQGIITNDELLREAMCYCPWKAGLQRQLHVASSSAQR